jgi:nucleoside-diphosphate-sugar epimerase
VTPEATPAAAGWRKPERLLIIGAGGFLGGHVRRQAAAAGSAVVTAGRSAGPGSPAHLRLDLAADCPGSMAQVIASVAPDAVVNCAGAVAGPPDVLAAANVIGPCALVRAMQLAGTRARLVHLGSAAEYGPAGPATTYGATKLIGTRLVMQARATGVDSVVLRVFNPVGSGAPASSLPGRAAAEVRRALAAGGCVRLGSLEPVRDFVDARDVADAVLAAAAVPAVPSAVLDIGSGRRVPARVLVSEIVAVSGYTGPVHEDGPRPAGPPVHRADIAPAQAGLGWQPRRTLAASAADLWEGSHA